ncbi:hypothetical protein Tco_1320087 [Tanacetum coccineum]
MVLVKLKKKGSRKRIYISYGKMMVIESSPMSIWLRSLVTSVVESDGAVECDEVILVSDGLEASNSLSVRGETGVGSDEVGV